ncbi:MAG: DUF1320 domain-containing protein [Candidatus Riflebacteria bacterium]|nr:DUF1320 domain-containing protein [Candidatus Riflebacteria bacterium]
MPYCVKQDMIDRFGTTELAELTANSTTIDDTVLARAMSGAEAEINGYLLAKYSLPLASPPDILKELNCDIARYKLYRKVPAPERIKDTYDEAVKTLEKISKGVISLGITSAQTPVAPVGGPQIENTDRVFDRAGLSGWDE